MPNRWLTHVKSVKRRNPGMKFSRVLKLASKSWKKGQSGGNALENGLKTITDTLNLNNSSENAVVGQEGSSQEGGRRGRRRRTRRKKRRTRSKKRRTRSKKRRRRRRRR